MSTVHFLTNSFSFFIDVIKFFLPVLVLMALLDMWIPKEKIQDNLGDKSGVKGVVLAILFGGLAAGPLFAAFPIAKSMLEKGVRKSNIVMFLGAWGTIKIPMVIMESTFLGIRFALLRLLVTLPFIIIVGKLVERFSERNKTIN